MATVGALVAKLKLDTSEFESGVGKAHKAASKLASMASHVIPLSGAFKRVTSAVHGTSEALDQGNAKASSYLKTLLGIGSASAMVATGVRAAFKVDRAQANMASAQGLAAPPDNMAIAYDKVTRAVTLAFESFGQAFSKSAGLASILDQLANIVSNLTPMFTTFGTVIGTVFGWLSNAGPVTIALVLAVKLLIAALTVLISIAIHVAIMRWVAAMTGIHAWTLICTAVSYAYAAAVWAVNAALAVLSVLGAPLWLAIGIAAAVVLGIMYALWEVWKWLTSEPAKGTAKTAGEMEKLNEKMKEQVKLAKKLKQEARNAIGDSLDAARKASEQAGKSDIEKAVMDAAHKGANPTEQAQIRSYLLHAEKINKAVEKWHGQISAINDLQKAMNQAGMSDVDKKLDDFKRGGITDPAQLDIIRQGLQLTEDANKLAAERKKLAQEIADLEFEAANHNLTAGQKYMAMLARHGATLAQLVDAVPAAERIDALNTQKKNAEEAKHLIEHLATPLEKYKKQLEDIQRLLKAGAISNKHAEMAAAAAQKEAIAGLAQNAARFKLDKSPQALMADTAAAFLAEDRNKYDPKDDPEYKVMLEQLAQLKRINAGLEANRQAIKGNKPVPDQVAGP